MLAQEGQLQFAGHVPPTTQLAVLIRGVLVLEVGDALASVVLAVTSLRLLAAGLTHLPVGKLRLGRE